MRHEHDVVVIGAGPAGAMAALHCARRGVSVLLVERSTFPRDKVCGCCINTRALALLDAAGLDERVRSLPNEPLRRVTLHTAGRRAAVPLPGGLAVSRAALDAMLVAAAQQAGAGFEPETSASVLPGGRVILNGPRGRRERSAGCLIVADGLAGRSLDKHPGFAVRVAKASRFGVGATLPGEAHTGPGEVVMACGRRGYVGMVRLGDGRTDVAAALCPAFARDAGGPGAAVMQTMREAGVAMPEALADTRWSGTPALTRARRAVWAKQTCVVGDAAGYVEPFTGEGIAWALAGGGAVAPLAMRAAQAWDDALGRAWHAQHARLIRRRQFGCRAVAALLRRPRLTAAAVTLLGIAPFSAAPLIRSITQPTPGSAPGSTPGSITSPEPA